MKTLKGRFKAEIRRKNARMVDKALKERVI